jgi:hypothetical protein
MFDTHFQSNSAMKSSALIRSGSNITVTTKTILASIALLSICGGGTSMPVLAQPKDAPPSPSPKIARIKFANDAFVPASGYIESLAVAGQRFGPALLTLGAAFRSDNRFSNDLAPDVRRVTNSLPAGNIKCLVKPAAPGTADYLASINPSNRPLQACRFAYHAVTTNSPILGKRIRLSGWLKTKEVEVMAGATLVILNADGHVFASDPMTDRPIQGTTDWMEIEIVTDIPAEPCTIYFGPSLYGPGELWADAFQIAIAPSDKPITDDRIWHVWSPNPGDYSVTTDLENTHDGRPSLCIAYSTTGAAPAGSWMWWGQDIRNPDKYRGHTVRMTVWIKSENVSNRVRPNLRPKGPYFKLLAQDKKVGGKNIRGTTDWSKHTILCEIPEDTQCLDTGFAFHGGGKFWIDMDSLQYEIADGETR